MHSTTGPLRDVHGVIQGREEGGRRQRWPEGHDSLMSIINNLATVTTTQTLTLGSTNLAKLSSEEKAIATNKGWTLA